MTVIQWVLILIAAAAVMGAVVRFRRGGMTLKPLVLWLIFWAAAVVVVLRPETASGVARIFGVGRGADVVVYLAIAVAFWLLFRLFAKIEDLERRMTKLVRELALKDLGK